MPVKFLIAALICCTLFPPLAWSEGAATRGVKKGAKETKGGLKKGYKETKGGIKKGVDESVGGTKKGFKETKKFFKKVF